MAVLNITLVNIVLQAIFQNAILRVDYQHKELVLIKQPVDVPPVGPLEIDRLSDNDYKSFDSRNASWLAANQDTTLRQVLIIHRHGDRTPISFPPKDTLSSEPFWQLHGLGQLTNRGKARMFMLGRLIRERYDNFLGKSVNKNWRKSRSSGALRCIESAQLFLAGLLRLNGHQSADSGQLSWDRKDNSLSQMWQPASINTLAAQYDGLLNEGAHCEALAAVHAQLDLMPATKRIGQQFGDVARVLHEHLGLRMDHFDSWSSASSVLEVERSYFPHRIKPQVLALYDRIQEAGDLSHGIQQSSLGSRRLQAGLLINDMIDNMKQFRDLTLNRSNSSREATFVKKFVHYSAHDLNLVLLLGMFESWPTIGRGPHYGANILLELHQDDDVWYVKLFYMAHVPSRPMELHLKECEQVDSRARCRLDKFDSLMGPYKIRDWQSWMRECGNELTSVDPYKQSS